jgi:hypothetical protein
MPKTAIFLGFFDWSSVKSKLDGVLEAVDSGKA